MTYSLQFMGKAFRLHLFTPFILAQLKAAGVKLTPMPEAETHDLMLQHLRLATGERALLIWQQGMVPMSGHAGVVLSGMSLLVHAAATKGKAEDNRAVLLLDRLSGELLQEE